jgi:NAD(P)-dependent dehydrogenase (short-subunit alcohol dehydrogenase family)
MKTLLITGGTTGFGRSLAEEALQRGHRAVLAVRNPGHVADLEERFPETAFALPFDLTDPEGPNRVVASTVARFGRLDVLLNNAGFGLLAALEETTDAQIDRNLATNFTGPLRLIRAALPVMREQKSGHIVNMSAIAAYANHAGFAVYGGAKAALDAASEAVAEEVAPHGIRFTLIVPGPFRTDFIARSLENGAAMTEYAGTVGKFGSILGKINGRQPGDPLRAAKVICDLLDAEKPPFRLLIGSYAHAQFSKKLASQESEMKAWRDTGFPTDFPAGT